MSKKQVRVADPKTRITSFIDQNASILLKDGGVLTGKITKYQDEVVTVLNHRLKKITVPISSITEFFVDIDA